MSPKSDLCVNCRTLVHEDDNGEFFTATTWDYKCPAARDHDHTAHEVSDEDDLI